MSTTEKIDLFKLHKADYVTPKAPVVLKIAKARYLSIRGRGAPGGPEFQDAIGALYGVAYTIKMTSKFAGRDYGVAKVEAQWWLDAGHDFMNAPRDTWNWRLLIRTPDFIGGRDLIAARASLRAKGKTTPVDRVELYDLTEGDCVQALHTGPYDRESETIAKMHPVAEQQGYAFAGLHHEIYLSDPRRVKPEKLRTILRMPVRRK